MRRAAGKRRLVLALLLWAIVVTLWVRHMLPGEKAETMYLGAAVSTVNEAPLPAQTPAVTPAVTPEPTPTPRQPESDAVYLAQCLWGEARGIPSQTEKAAVVWCVLNRVDHPGFPDTIHGVLSAPNQFLGFSERFPVDPELLALAQDVLDRRGWRCGQGAAERLSVVLRRRPWPQRFPGDVPAERGMAVDGGEPVPHLNTKGDHTMHNPFGDRSAAEIWELVKEWLWRIFAPRAYADLWQRYQYLRRAMDERDEEYETDITDADLRIKELEARCAALEALEVTGNT